MNKKHLRKQYEPYFVGQSGEIYFFHDIGIEFRRRFVGKPQNFKEQLQKIGLWEEFSGGQTPCVIPARF